MKQKGIIKKQILTKLQLVEEWILGGYKDDEIPYILTKDDEKEVLDWQKTRYISGLTYKFSISGNLSKVKLEEKIQNIKWDKVLDYEKINKDANLRCIRKVEDEIHTKKEKSRVREENEKLIKEWDARRFLIEMRRNCIKNKGSDLIEDEYTLPLIKTLCYFFSKDIRFETELGYSFKKGLILQSNCGVGKNFLINLISNNPVCSIKTYSTEEISEEIRKNGDYYINESINKIHFGDVGAELSTVKKYGNSINFLKTFLQIRYDYVGGYDFSKLILSTNNSFDELEEIYGYRLRSRFHEMFNVLNINCYDIRKYLATGEKVF